MENSIEVPAPKDAKCREVPLNVKVMYGDKGVEYGVCCLIFMNMTEICEAGRVVELITAENKVRRVSLDYMYLEKPDSWEQLEKDSTAFDDGQTYGPCHYFHELGDDCMSCPARDDACADAAMRDVASRIRKLRGEDDA